VRTIASILLLALLLPADELAEERRTEQIANMLLEFAEAWRKGDTEKLASYFAENVQAHRAPRTTTLEGAPVGFQSNRSPMSSENLREMTRAEAAAELVSEVGFLRHVDHLSVKPYAASFEGDEVEIAIKVEIVGRHVGGQPHWTRFRLGLLFRKGRIVRVRRGRHAARAARRTPFREVSIDSGLIGRDPAGLAHPTLGLAAYGAAAADVDNDGDIDIFETGHFGNTLWVNDGKGKFKGVPIKTPGQATGPLFLDYDNDGDADIFCSANGTQMLLENKGGLKFEDVSAKAGVAVKSIGFTATAGDINGDRVPDIYVAAYNAYGPVAPASWDDANNGLPNLLFVSNGDGTYTECAKKMGVAGRRWSYSAQFLDVDEDGQLDLYVTNDFGAGNRLYLRRGDKFEDRAKEWGVRDDGYGMGVDFGDYDNDGRLDLYVTKMSSTAGNRLLNRMKSAGYEKRLRALAAGNSLYRNVGGKFENVAGPFPAGWSWGGGFIDIDNDGYEDIYSPNGHFSGAKEKDT